MSGERQINAAGFISWSACGECGGRRWWVPHLQQHASNSIAGGCVNFICSDRDGLRILGHDAGPFIFPQSMTIGDIMAGNAGLIDDEDLSHAGEYGDGG